MAADDRDENFLTRWSRLKGKPAAAPGTGGASAAAEPKAAAVAPAAPDDRKEKVDPAALPSIDSLTGDSDFTAFLREGVPEALRRQALRKLWISDPVIAAPDVLDIHNIDYFNMPSFPEGVKTLFRVGQGMLDDGEEVRRESPAAKPPPESGGGTPPAPETSSDSDAMNAASQHQEGLPLLNTSDKLPEV